MAQEDFQQYLYELFQTYAGLLESELDEMIASAKTDKENKKFVQFIKADFEKWKLDGKPDRKPK